MANTDCFLCQKQNCVSKCPKPNCNAYYCSEAHYSSHVVPINPMLQPANPTTENYSSAKKSHNAMNGDCVEGIVDHSKDNIVKEICFPFKVINSDVLGRHFIATRDIKPLELILVDPPAVVGPATKTKPVCIICLGPLVGKCRYKSSLLLLLLYISILIVNYILKQ